MKKLLLLLLLCAPALTGAGMAIAPGTAAHTHSDANSGGGTLTVSDTLSSTKACVTGYDRVTPNLCRKTSFTSSTSLVRDVVTLVTGPTGAKGLVLFLSSTAGAANAILDRQSLVNVYTDSGATVLVTQFSATAREAVATAAGTPLLNVSSEFHVQTDSSSRVWLKLTDDAGNQGACSYVVLGYYD